MLRITLSLLLLTTSVSALASQNMVLTVTPQMASSGQPLRIAFANRGSTTFMMASSAPWVIVDSQQAIVFAPIGLQVVTPIPPNGLASWTWDQRDNNQRQVPAGSYTVLLTRRRPPASPLIFKAPFTITGATLRATGTYSPGSLVTLQLTAPSKGGRVYQTAVALADKPGIPMGQGRVLGLRLDNLFIASVLGGPPVFRDFAGRLDQNGQGVSWLRIPNDAALRGVRFFAGFCALDPVSPAGIGAVSPTIPVTVQ